VIENNTIRYAKGLGLDIGANSPQETMENRGRKFEHREVQGIVVRNNWICDNGHCGLTGLGHYGTQVLGNVIERNNRTGYTSPWWEFAGIKFHHVFDAVIEGNLVRDNDAHGIWIDNQWRGTRISRNVILNNLWSGINVELGRGPALIDNNIIAYTRQGDGIYGHDLADITIAHNLLYANSNFGIWVAYCTPRVKPEDGCWDIKAFNNMILGNRVGAIAYPIPYSCGGRNESDGNLFMGGGEYLDEGSRASRPLFQVTNKTHMGQEPEWAVGPAQTGEFVAGSLQAILEEKGISREDWPNLKWWQEHFLLSFDLWQKALGHDAHSAEIKVNRDGLQSRNVSWEFDFDEGLHKVRCKPVPGVEKDFRGRPLEGEKLLPGPFQELKLGRNHITLWPVRGVRTTWLLG
jgi:parallel beta-helix repeat protein